MKNNIIKFTSVFILAITTISCFPNKVGKLYPEPAANPFFISKEAQTVDIKVKNLSEIEPYKSQWDDKITHDAGGSWYSILIENEWITIHYKNSNGKRNLINVSVKENPYDVPRSYNLRLKYKPQTTLFTITQRGRK